MSRPLIIVIARPALDKDAIERFLQAQGMAWRQSAGTTDSENVVEVAGRMCYMSFGRHQSRDNSAYISNLIQQGHESVLEHAAWTFLMSNVSRAFSHQFVRHRIGFSFSQLSQQYHDESDATFIEPDVVSADPTLHQLWSEATKEFAGAYRRMLTEIERKLGKAPPGREGKESRRSMRSAARSVLPNATETKMAFSANARAIRHFLLLRGNIPGDEEMRVVSLQLLKIMKLEAPALFADFEEFDLGDGRLGVRRVNCI